MARPKPGAAAAGSSAQSPPRFGTVAALYNADVILITGPWGIVPGAVELIAEQFEVESSVNATIRPADLGDEAPLVGARIRALEIARSQVIEDLINSS